ncbi:MAG: DNA polymerase III subunit alpha [Holosporales bacterium]|jgi:DNA polymerase-3 subunit alpha|nr:DNA polymerase III subunit alpha [Holosporales bacterium]
MMFSKGETRFRKIMSELPFVHLRTHSAYSLSKGALKVRELVGLCVKNRMPAIAITDLGNLFGALEFSLECAGKGIQPIIGCALNMQGFIGKKHFTQTSGEQYQLILLVQNDAGYKNLIKLVSDYYLRSSDPIEPELTLNQLKDHTDGLIALSSGKHGEIGQLLVLNQKDGAVSCVNALNSLFPGRFYMEISRHSDYIEQRIEEDLINIALDKGLPIVATNDVFFGSPDTYEAHDVLMCIGQGVTLSEPQRITSSPEYYFKSEAEMRDLFKDLPEAINNTAVIAQRCAFIIEKKKPILPVCPVSEGRTEEDELRYRSEIGLEKRLASVKGLYGITDEEFENFSKKYYSRIEYEIKILIQMGFCGYFLIVADFVQWAKSKKIPVGPGRGSGAGSVVAWALTITNVDPIRFSLLFERFLNPERVSMPDFDIDFCQKHRDEVIEYVRSKYGYDKVAQIITFGKLQARAVLRDVGRVLQIPYGYVDKICKLVPNNPALNITIEQAIEMDPALKKYIEDDPKIKQLIDISVQLEGLYRHASTHAAGVVIGREPLEEIVALYRDPKSEIPVTQFNMKYIESTGLVKFDFLGLKTLTVIQKAIDLLGKRGIHLVVEEVPLDDKKTFDLFNRLETVGVFQVESGGMKEVTKNMCPDRFEDLIALIALYRPGPMDDIPRYISCKHGAEEVVCAHPLIEPILKETYGVMVYQEQVMQIAQVLSGYTLGQADLLRRAMGKKIKEEMDSQRKRFVEGAAQSNNVEPELANQLFDQISKFAGYGFNKSHATPYALLSYQTAYLKANYPVEFMAALMNLDIGNTEKLCAYKQELQNMGIPLLPPDINKSESEFSVESADGKLVIRYALSAIKGQGAAAMEAIVKKRNDLGRSFTGLIDLSSQFDSRVSNKKHFDGLVCAGCFDSISSSRRTLFDNVERALLLGAKQQEDQNSAQESLFAAKKEPKYDKDFFPESPKWSNLEQLSYELKAFGFYISSHPLESYKKHLDDLFIRGSAELREFFGNNPGGNCYLAGVVLDVRTKTSKNGNKLAFVTMSDMQSAFDVVVFSDLLVANRSLLEIGKILRMSVVGKLQDGELRLSAQSIEPLDDVVTKKISSLNLTVRTEKDLIQAQKIISQLNLQTNGVDVTLCAVINDYQAELFLGKYSLTLDALFELDKFIS